MQKISVYLKDETAHDMKLLANYYGEKLTAIIDKALTAYLEKEHDDLEFARSQEQARQERQQRKQQQNDA